MSVSNYNVEYTGSGQTVVIIDTGASHQFSNNNIVYQWDFADNDGDTYSGTPWNDYVLGGHHHGGQVATVAQDVASGINIIHLKVFSDDSETASYSTIESALQWVLENNNHYNIAAVNMSLGSGNTGSYMQDGWLLDDEYKALDDLDIITTVAAGNDAEYFIADGVNLLAASESVIAVSAVDSNNEFTDFSQKHSELTDIAALGQHVPIGNSFLSGTSFSAPIIAGAAAIIQEIAVDLLGHKITDEQFLDIIQKTANDIEASSYEDDIPEPFIPPWLTSWHPFSEWSSKQQSDVQYITPAYDPGRNIATAYEINPISNNVVINNTLGSDFDIQDYYSFTLDYAATVSFDLTDLQGDVDLLLMDSQGHTIIYEWDWGNVDLNITQELDAGESYHIVTDSWDKKPTSYTLSIDFNGGIDTEIPGDDDSPEPPNGIEIIIPDSDPGAYIHTAYEIDPSSNQVEISETLSRFDDKDYYSFSLDNDATVDFSLTGLDGDVDLILRESSGHTLVHRWEWGNVDLHISEFLSSDETYYIITDTWDGKDTDYTLSINFNGGIDGTQPPSEPEDPPLPDTIPAGYAGINIQNAVNYFEDNYQDYAVV